MDKKTDLISRIKEHYESMSKGQKKLAKYITSNSKIPAWLEPTKVAIFIAIGPGVDSATAMKFINCSSVSQPLVITASITIGIIA